jgi:hypothetical protein
LNVSQVAINSPARGPGIGQFLPLATGNFGTPLLAAPSS